MSTWRRKLAVVAATSLVAAGVAISAASPATAQVSVVVGVVFEHLTDGTTVTCPFEAPEGPTSPTGDLVTCDVNANASGGQLHNSCREGASARVGPLDAGAGVSGCSVTVEGTILVGYTGTWTPNGPVYNCGGGGLGTATYTPSAQGAGQSMSGIVAISWDEGALTVDGALANLSTISVGHIHAEGFDPCDPNDNLAHPFAGLIN